MRSHVACVLCAFLAGSASAQSWLTTGNSGTSGSTNFIGTTDAVALNFRSNNSRVMSLFNQLTSVSTDQYNGVVILGGSTLNTINAGATSSTVFGGLNFNSNDFGNHAYDIGTTISGGVNNFAGRDNGFLANEAYATVCGGSTNWAQGNASSVLGGNNNQATNSFASALGGNGNRALGIGSVAAGGDSNSAGGDYSFAAGRNAVIRSAATIGDSDGDQGTFLWADASTSSAFTSTGPNQFLVRAAGGMGVGTASPTGVFDAAGAGGFSFPQFVVKCTTNGSDSWSRVAFTNSNTNKFWHFSALCNGATNADDQLNYYYQSAGQGRNIMQIRGDGRIGIGGPAPGTGVTLDIFGTARCVSLIQTSSQRYKTDVQPLPSVLDRFLRLTPVSFTWDSSHGGTQDVGLIAEDVAAVFPEAVATIDGKVEGINYSRVTALAIQAFKEQQGTVESLKAENAVLKARLDRIEKLLENSTERR